MSAIPSQETINAFVVASHFDLDKVKALLSEHPALLNENAEWIETAIQAAAHVNNLAIMDYLIGQGAPIDICTAAVRGQLDDVQAMLADDPGLKDAIGPHGIRVLYYPALGGHRAIAEALLTAGAPVNAPGPLTPLVGAVMGGHIEMVRWMLDHDADPYGTDFEGRSALEIARAQGFQAAVDLLKDFYDDADSENT